MAAKRTTRASKTRRSRSKKSSRSSTCSPCQKTADIIATVLDDVVYKAKEFCRTNHRRHSKRHVSFHRAIAKLNTRAKKWKKCLQSKSSKQKKRKTTAGWRRFTKAVLKLLKRTRSLGLPLISDGAYLLHDLK